MSWLERRYTGPRGKVAHLLPPRALADGYVASALCGLWAWHHSAWRGTGSQDEYDRAESLPTCKTCERKAQPNA